MADNRQLDIYADSILSFFGKMLLWYDEGDSENYLADLETAIGDGDVMNIPKNEWESSLRMAVDKAVDTYPNDDFDDSMDGDFDSGMASAGMGTDEDYGMYEENVIRDANELLHLLSESNASRKAKKLGLVHIGFGNYAEEQGTPAKYKTVNGKLKKVGGTTVKKQKDPGTSSTSIKKKEDTKKKKVQSGIKDLRRVSGEKFTYEFEKDGRKYKFTLNKKERKQLAGKASIMTIVKSRLKSREEKEKSKQFKKGKHVSQNAK